MLDCRVFLSSNRTLLIYTKKLPHAGGSSGDTGALAALEQVVQVNFIYFNCSSGRMGFLKNSENPFKFCYRASIDVHAVATVFPYASDFMWSFFLSVSILIRATKKKLWNCTLCAMLLGESISCIAVPRVCGTLRSVTSAMHCRTGSTSKPLLGVYLQSDSGLYN